MIRYQNILFYSGMYSGDRDLPRWLNTWKDGRFRSVSQDLFSKSTTARISLKSPAIYITPYMTRNKLAIPWIRIYSNKTFQDNTLLNIWNILYGNNDLAFYAASNKLISRTITYIDWQSGKFLFSDPQVGTIYKEK